MRAIQKNEGTGWVYTGREYAGLTDADIKVHLKMLRTWAREDGSTIKYRAVNVELTQGGNEK